MAIVALGFVPSLLLDLKNADDEAGQEDAPGRSQPLHDHDIDRISVIGLGPVQ